VNEGDYFTVARTNVELGLIELTSDRGLLIWEPRRAANVEVYREEPRVLMAGDWLRWTRNDRELGRRSGEKVSVLSLDTARALATVAASGRKAILASQIAKDIGSTRMLQRSMRHKVKPWTA